MTMTVIIHTANTRVKTVIKSLLQITVVFVAFPKVRPILFVSLRF